MSEAAMAGRFPHAARRGLAALFIASALGGCGGGGSGLPTPPSAPRVAPGAIDTRFASDGTFLLDAPPGAHVAMGASLSRTASGDFWFTGSYRLASGSDSAAIDGRLTSSGLLDRAFAGTGFIVTPIVAGRRTPGIWVGKAPDDGVFAARTDAACSPWFCSPGEVVIRRMDVAGNPVAAYGAGGRVSAQMRPGSVLLSDNGTITLLGTSEGHARATRFDAEGVADLSFAATATSSLDCGFGAGDLRATRMTDGRMVAAILGGPNLCVVRMRHDGSLDPSFAGGGRIIRGGFPALPELVAVLAQPDGGMAIIATSVSPGAGRSSYLLRLAPGGVADASGPMLLDALVDFVKAAAVEPDGKIILAGHRLVAAQPSEPTRVVRLLRDGRADPSFGASGQGYAALGTVENGLDPEHLLVTDEPALYVTGSWGPIDYNAQTPRRLAVMKLGGGGGSP